MEEVKSKNLLLKEIKTFKELEKEIIDNNKCCACGACVAYCTSQGFDVIKMDGYKPTYITDANIDNCKECGICYYICPNTTPLLDQINEEFQIKDELGHIITVIAAKTTDQEIKKLGQDGGIVTTVLTYLFEQDRIDAAIVSEYDENFKPVPKIIYDKKDLLKSAGTRYSISSNILPLKDFNKISQEIMNKKDIFNIEDLSIAFVGTPCQCRAIRKMQHLSISPIYSIRFVIGLFCFENFDYDKLFEIIEKETKLVPANVLKAQIKKNFFVTSRENKVFEVDIKKLDEAVRDHCHECDEFTGRFSDFSVGASGAPEGHSIIIIRTNEGQNLINSLLSEGFIDKYNIPAKEISEWKTKKINWFRKMTSLKTKKGKLGEKNEK